MFDENTLMSMVDNLYANVGHLTATWPSSGFLQSVASVTDARLALMRHCDRDRRLDRSLASSMPDPGGRHDYAHRYGPMNPWVWEAASDALIEGSVVRGEDLVSNQRLEATEFYQSFLQPRGLYHSMNVVIETHDAASTHLTVLRERSAGAFDEASGRVLRTLLPHLRGALKLRTHLLGHQHIRSTLEHVLDMLPVGVLLLDGHGCVAALNRAARNVVERRDGLSLDSEQRPRAALLTESRELSRLIERACESGLAAERVLPHNQLVTRPSGLASLQVVVIDLRSPAALMDDELSRLALFVSDPEVRAEPSPERVRELYGLTPAEARLVCALMVGLSVEDAARQLGISTNTARTHLKRIFSKTSTQRQGDLISLVLSGVAMLGDRTAP